MPRPPSRKVYKSKSKTRKKAWCLRISKSLLGADEQEKTYFATEKKARFALGLSEALARKHGIPSIPMDDRDRKAALKAKEAFAEMGMTFEDAVEDIKARKAEEAASVIFSALVTLYLAHLATKDRKRTAKYLNDIQRIGEVWAGELGELPVCRLTFKRIEEGFAKLKLTTSSKNAHIRVLRMVLRYGVKPGYLDGKIVGTLDLEEIETDVRILSPNQARALMDASPPDLVPYWAVCLFAGLRPQSEAFRLEWKDVNFKTKKICVKRGKLGELGRQGRTRYVPMEPNLIAWLEPYSGLTGLLCPTKNWKRKWLATRAEADQLLVKAKCKEEATLLGDWSQDVTRHSTASYWCQKEGDMDSVASRLGHLPSTLRDKYHVDLEDDADAKRYFGIRPRKVKNVIPMAG